MSHYNQQIRCEPVRWLITGGAGFIGTNLIFHLLSKHKEAEIIVLDNLSAGSLENLRCVLESGEAEDEPIESKTTFKAWISRKVELSL